MTTTLADLEPRLQQVCYLFDRCYDAIVQRCNDAHHALGWLEHFVPLGAPASGNVADNRGSFTVAMLQAEALETEALRCLAVLASDAPADFALSSYSQEAVITSGLLLDVRRRAALLP